MNEFKMHFDNFKNKWVHNARVLSLNRREFEESDEIFDARGSSYRRQEISEEVSEKVLKVYRDNGLFEDTKSFKEAKNRVNIDKEISQTEEETVFLTPMHQFFRAGISEEHDLLTCYLNEISLENPNTRNTLSKTQIKCRNILFD